MAAELPGQAPGSDVPLQAGPAPVDAGASQEPGGVVAEPLVTVSGLDHWFFEGGMPKQVLREVTLCLHPGEILILTGPSGPGLPTAAAA